MSIYLVIILGAMVGGFLLDLVIERLNLRHMSPDLPAGFEGYYDADRYRKSQEYLRDTTRFGLASAGFFTALGVALIVGGGFPAIERLARAAGFGPIGTGLLFLGIFILGYELLHVPFAAYSTFAIEERYGFNRTTPGTFALDFVKGVALTALLGGLLGGTVLWIFIRLGPTAWLLCWGVIVAFKLFVVFIAPVAIMPLFNTFTPLPDGELRGRIEAYARGQGFRLSGVFTMDGSKRSAKANAYFTGFGRFRRIVLYDTLVARHTTDELVAVLAHEMGHYRQRHVQLFVLMSTITTGLMLFVVSRFIGHPGLCAAFGLADPSVHTSMLFAAFLYAPVGLVLSVLAHVVSRACEYAADAYTVRTTGLGDALAIALKKLTADNLGNLTPHPLKVFIAYSHPPVSARVRAIERAMQANAGKESGHKAP